MQKMSEKEAAEALKKLFGEYELDLPGQDSLEALHIAISALEEIQQYKAIGLTPQMVKDLIKSEKQAHKIALENVERLDEYKALEEQGLLLRLPAAVGDTVYVICQCGTIPKVLDGTLYESDGSPGTATGYYCPYEDRCPHECMDCDDLFNCDKYQFEHDIFEDEVQTILINENGVEIATLNCPVCSEIGRFVFLTKEEAEAALEKMNGEEHEV